MDRDTALSIANQIAYDIIGRKGVGDEFEQIDDDIQTEIIEGWVEIILGEQQ